MRPVGNKSWHYDAGGPIGNIAGTVASAYTNVIVIVLRYIQRLNVKFDFIFIILVINEDT